MNTMTSATKKHIVLASHPGGTGDKPPPVNWGATSPGERGPIVSSLADPARRNVIGTHSGAYGLYRAVAVAAGTLNPVHVPDLTDTAPAEPIGPHPQWHRSEKIVSLDPYGHVVSEAFADRLEEGWDIRPTIAVTRAHVNMPEIKEAMREGRLKADGDILVEQMANWFRDNRPDINVEVRRKSGVYTERDENLYEEIQQKGAGAVMAVGH